MTKDSNITEKMSWLKFSFLPRNRPEKYQYEIVSQKEWSILFVSMMTSLKYYDILLSLIKKG